jgi:RND family efflux transporter MFP subunit
MKINWKKITGIIAGIALVSVFVVKLISNKNIAEEKVYQYDKTQAINIQVDTLRFKNSTYKGSYTGTYQPNKESRLSAEIQGKVDAVLVDAGSVVSKGQALVQLDLSMLKLQLQAIDVKIEGLQADVNRYTILAEADAIQGVTLEKAENGLKAAKVQRETVLKKIEKSTIRAPFDGVITAKMTEEGAFAAPGVPLLQITDIGNLKFTINVAEKDLKHFKANQSYPISVDAFPDMELTGKAIMIGSKANMASSFPIQFLVSNTPDLKIKSGMFGKVHPKTALQEQHIVIPPSSVIGGANQPQVYLINEGKAELKSITVSKTIEDKVVVSAGLNQGDVIVTGGFINLFDGANITIK